jgi:hypothetical protein
MQNPCMSSRSRLFLVGLGWLALTVAGCVVIAQHAMGVARADFLSEASVMHRLLSQQVRQHETLVETLALVQPSQVGLGEGPPEQRLTALHPAVLRVLRQDDVVAWPEALAADLDAALERSLAAGRAVALDLGPAGAGFWLVRAGKPASFALQFDLRQVAKEAMESPFAAPSTIAAWLEQGSQTKIMLTGQSAPGVSAGESRYQFRQTLTARSMNVDLVVTRAYDPVDWPWEVLAAWCVATSFLALGLAAWLQARRPVAVHEASRFVFDDDDRFGDPPPSGWNRRRAAPSEFPRQPTAPAGQSLNMTLRELDVERPELAVARGAIDQAARESRRSSEMIANLRRNAEQQVQGDRLQPLLWDELLRDAFELVEPHCARLGVTTTLITDDEAAFVLADRVALEQVISRLLDQAVMALAQSPANQRQLDVTLSAQPDVAVLSVHDTRADLSGLSESAGAAADAVQSLRARELKQLEQLLAEMSGRLSVELLPPRGVVIRVALPRVKA